ncbi:MAG: penicillin-binding protein 2 [Burkholderiaceae bacterium]
MARKSSQSTHPLLRVKLSPARSRTLMLVLALAFVSLAARAAYLQVFNDDYLREEGGKRYEIGIELPASRGRILDRNGVVLAASLPARSVAVFPGQLHEPLPSQQVSALARLLDQPERELRRKLEEEDRNYVYLKRQVDLDVAGRIDALKIPGLDMRREYKRHYPEGDMLAHVIGFTNVEDRGQEGIELSQQSQLAGQPGHRRVIRDRLGRPIEDVQAIREPRDGGDVTLSIDSKIQFLVHNALADAMREQRAKAAAAVVIDVQTGEVLALSNFPNFNPNDRRGLSGAQLRNRVMTDTFEPGSTMKPFTVALALELNKTTPRTVIQTAPGKLTIGGATIGDAHPHGPLTVEQIIEKSSNVGTAKLALGMQPHDMWSMFVSLGFGQAPQIGFPGAVAGRVRPYKNWKPIEQATMSYGHGISVSLVQMARAYTVFARNGDIVPLSMMKTDGPVAGVQIVRPEVAQAMRRMLEMAAGPKGTAPKAQVVGYSVAGKTGTAYKQENGRYVKKYVSSFVGFAPASNPRLVVAVMVDEPGAGKHYGGEVAAPVFSRIVGDSLRAMRVAPDTPFAKLVIPDKAVEESL